MDTRRCMTLFAIGLATISVASTAQAVAPGWYIARSQLLRIREALVAYRMTHGVYPQTTVVSTWFEKLCENQNSFNPLWECRTPSTGPLDIWGSPIEYIPPAPGSTEPPTLRSFGVNKRNDGGAKDDITTGRPLNAGYYWKKSWPQMYAAAAAFILGLPVFVKLCISRSRRTGRHVVEPIAVYISVAILTTTWLSMPYLFYAYASPPVLLQYLSAVAVVAAIVVLPAWLASEIMRIGVWRRDRRRKTRPCGPPR